MQYRTFRSTVTSMEISSFPFRDERKANIVCSVRTHFRKILSTFQETLQRSYIHIKQMIYQLRFKLIER